MSFPLESFHERAVLGERGGASAHVDREVAPIK
jgi:hypothetical protein